MLHYVVLMRKYYWYPLFLVNKVGSKLSQDRIEYNPGVHTCTIEKKINVNKFSTCLTL